MMRERVRDLLTRVADGTLSTDLALDDLAQEPFESIDFATIDHHRALRQGFPEVIYGAGKTAEHVREIATHMIARGAAVLATRLAPEAGELLRATLPNVELNAVARTAYVPGAEPAPRGNG